MHASDSLFFEEWRSCLHAHYLYVLRTGDTITEPTLRQVLLNTGFTEDDVAEMRAEAEALGWLEPDDALPAVAGDLPLEPAADDEDWAEDDDWAEDGEALPDDEAPFDDDSTQLSLF
jgi:hypothetical protein